MNGIQLASQEIKSVGRSKNEAQDKRNWGEKDAAKECLKPEESIRAK
jgi:hypothetical protein